MNRKSAWPGVTIGIVIVGIALRWWGLGTKSLWFDEGYTAWVVSHPPAEIVRLIKADTAPPLYYLILRGWTRHFGSSEAGLRSLSATCATLSLIAVWRLMTKTLRPAAAAVGVAFFAFGFMQVAYAHEARFYAMMSLLGVLDFWLVWSLCESGSVWRLAATAICWSISLYLNNVMGIYLACLGIAWLLLPGARPIAQRVVDAAVVTLIAAASFAPWVPSLVGQARAINGHFWPAVPLPWVFWRTIAEFAGVNEDAFPTFTANPLWRINSTMEWLRVYAYFFIGGGLAIGLGLAVAWSRRRRLIAAALAAGIGPVVLVYAYSHFAQSIFMDRAFMGTAFAVPLLIGLILDGAPDRKSARRVAMALGILGLSAFETLSANRLLLREHDEDWRSLAARVGPSSRRRLIVFNANEGEMLFDYYALGGDFSRRPDQTGTPAGYFEIDPPHTMRRVLSDADVESLRATLRTNDFDEVVYLQGHRKYADPDDRTRKLLEATFGPAVSEMSDVERETGMGLLVFERIKR